MKEREERVKGGKDERGDQDRKKKLGRNEKKNRWKERVKGV